VIRATKKYGWRLWLAGFLLAGTCFAQTWGSMGAGTSTRSRRPRTAIGSVFTAGTDWERTTSPTESACLATSQIFTRPARIFIYSFMAFPTRSPIKRGLRLSSLSALVFFGVPPRSRELVCVGRWRRPLDSPHAVGIVPDHGRISYEYCQLECWQQFCPRAGFTLTIPKSH